MEFYLSDSNLSRDKFLLELLKKSEDRWFPLATIASFQRMKRLTEDLAVIVEALKASTVLEVSECGEKVRRVTPLPSEKADDLPRSLYAKGFSEDATLDDIQNLLEGHLLEKEKVCLVRMRRFRGGENANKFKGSVFIEFDSEATAQRFVALEVKPTEDAPPLLLRMKGEYMEEKKAMFAERKNAKKRGGASKAEEKEEGSDEGNKKRKAEDEVEEKEFQKDLIVKVCGLGGECLREDLKEVLEAQGCKVLFVEYARGAEMGYCRLGEGSENSASVVVKALTEAGTEIKGFKAAFTALADAEEAEYWSKVRSNMKGKGGKGGKGGNKKQRR